MNRGREGLFVRFTSQVGDKASDGRAKMSSSACRCVSTATTPLVAIKQARSGERGQASCPRSYHG